MSTHIQFIIIPNKVLKNRQLTCLDKIVLSSHQETMSLNAKL